MMLTRVSVDFRTSGHARHCRASPRRVEDRQDRVGWGHLGKEEQLWVTQLYPSRRP